MACAFGVAIAPFFQHVKAKLDAGMTDAECFDLLSTDGMLVKRPLLVGDDFAIPGFKEGAWAEVLGLDR